ncbi:MAG: ABC transporter ATP-binding protein [Armatimonadetes bacterium]|nr:ABC transporter ATP-binding protein [Armatimonadota bacterium]
MNQEQASQGLYGWLVRTIVSERLPGSGREMFMLCVLSVVVLALEIGALVSMMMLFSSLFATESVPMEHTLSIPQWMALLLAIYLARGIFTYILQTTRHDMARRWAMRYAAKATRHVLRLPLETHRRWDLSNLMPILIFCASGLDDLVEASVIALPLDALSTVAVIAFLGLYQPELTVILVAVYLSYALPYFAWKGREEEIAAFHQQQANSLFDSMTQALVGIREIKVFRAVAAWMKRFGQSFFDLEQTGKQSAHLNERDEQTQMFIFTASGTLVILGAVLFFLAPALKTDADRMALTGQVFVFVLAQNLLSTPLIGLMGAARSFRQAAPELVMLRQILAEPEEVESTGYTGDLAGFGQRHRPSARIHHAGPERGKCRDQGGRAGGPRGKQRLGKIDLPGSAAALRRSRAGR